jgi:phosphoglycerate dehydrogenase-like enzyme
MARPVALIAEPIHEEFDAWLGERCEISRRAPDEGRDFLEALRRSDALVVRTYTTVGERLLDLAPNLRVVGRAGVGLDNIDVEACRARGVEVVHTPEANAEAVCELVYAFILDAIRPRVFLDRALDSHEWSGLRSDLVAPRQIAGSTLGVMGFGRIGRRVARVARAFGARVLFHDLLEIPASEWEGASPADFGTLLAESDVVSIHVDEREANRRLIDAEAMRLLRPDVVLVNTSRGMVMDPEALAAFLRANPGAQALLDVHEPEPFRSDHPLLGLPNAHLAPHIGSATAPAKRAMSAVVEDVWRVLCGERPRHPAPADRAV